MRKYAGFDNIPDAADFRRMLIAEGTPVEEVTLMEVAEAARLSSEKPYLVTWTEWSED